jgi:hypothetical protein
MTLDLAELLAGWNAAASELRARAVIGRDGAEFVQLRVDLGVMQMHVTGRPDGERYHGLPSVREYVEHELRVGGQDLVPADWQELQRELTQLNYRRLAFSAVAEEALRRDAPEEARRYIERALADIQCGLADYDLLAGAGPLSEDTTALQPALLFDRARLTTQLRVIDRQYEEAIEEAELGARELESVLHNLGCDDEQCADDPGLSFLRGMGAQLRREYGVTRTAVERLNEAIESEDFETAAQIRDELRRRRGEQTD